MPEHDLPDLIRLIEADDGAVRRIPFQQFCQLFPAGIRSGKQFLLRRNSRFFECGEIAVAGTRHRSIDEQDVPAAPFQQTGGFLIAFVEMVHINVIAAFGRTEIEITDDRQFVSHRDPFKSLPPPFRNSDPDQTVHMGIDDVVVNLFLIGGHDKLCTGIVFADFAEERFHEPGVFVIVKRVHSGTVEESDGLQLPLVLAE